VDRFDVEPAIDGVRACLRLDLRLLASSDVSITVAEHGGGRAFQAAVTAVADVCGADAFLRS
jgi:hypothetical protein